MTINVSEIRDIQGVGVKGPNAVQWLLANGVVIPGAANTWAGSGGSLVLRLGNSEFMLESHAAGYLLESASQPVAAGVYKVQRADASFIISGTQALDLFSELCLLDLRDGNFAADAVLMTQVAGISATVIRQQNNSTDVYRVWCDGTYGAFMRETLHEIAAELDS